MKFPWFLALVTASTIVGCGSSNNTSATSNSTSIADAASDVASDAPSMAPVANLTANPNQWVWTPVEGAKCRDGSGTGFAVNLASPASNNLVIYLEGGGACVDEVFCATTPPSFGESDFATWHTSSTTDANSGIFNRTDAANPVAGWNFVYIPYCTGDIFVGDNPNGMVSGVSGTQQFVGYTDIGLDLDRIVPTFPGLTKVLLTGISAGGFGASANYVQAARHFGSTPIYLLDDSGPPMEAPYLATCMQTQFATLWGMGGALADCGSDCSDPSTYFIDFAKHVAKTYPNVPFGLIDSSEDAIISLFFGYGNPSNCMPGLLPESLPAATFTAGLQDAEEQLAGAPNFGSFILGGSRDTQHTSLGASSTFDGDSTNVTASLLVPDGGIDEDAGTIALTTWIATLVNDGKVSNVGP